MAAEEIEDRLLEHANALYEQQEATLTPELMRSVERELMLRVIDGHWVYHLTSIENLRQGIGLHAFGQRDPLVMYKTEGHKMFQELLGRIQNDIVHAIFHVSVNLDGRDGRGGRGGQKRADGGKSVMDSVMGARSRDPAPSKVGKVGRNEPCPCGSGKKYKRCHGA